MKIMYALLLLSAHTGFIFGYSDEDKIFLIQEKLVFITSQKEAFNKIMYTNKCILQQAQELAHYILQDSYLSLKQQIKSTVKQVLETQEFASYHNYSVALKAPLIGRDNIRAKAFPVIRPDHSLSKKINDILLATVPSKLLQQIEVLTLFECYLNYKMDQVEAHSIITQLEILEKRLREHLTVLENKENIA